MELKVNLLTGFKATKNGISIKYQTQMHDIGIYIDYYVGESLKNRTTRNSVKKVNNYLEKRIKELSTTQWEVERFPTIRIYESTNIPKFRK